MDRVPTIGELVVFHDSKNRPHNALILCVHNPSAVNLIFVSGDKTRQDSWGRQTEKESSVCYKMGVHGMYWRYKEDTPCEYKAPIAT